VILCCFAHSARGWGSLKTEKSFDTAVQRKKDARLVMQTEYSTDPLLVSESLGSLDPVDDARSGKRTSSLTPIGRRVLTDEVVGEADVKLLDVLDRRDLLGRELEGEGLDVLVEVLDLSTSNDGEDVRSLGEDV
jgi:hypothetical protein